MPRERKFHPWDGFVSGAPEPPERPHAGSYLSIVSPTIDSQIVTYWPTRDEAMARVIEMRAAGLAGDTELVESIIQAGDGRLYEQEST